MKRVWEAPALWIGLSIIALVWRLTLGVDLGDEAYYAAFVDGWLKVGLGNNTFLMVHQTADLLVYPFAFLYREVRGDAAGLVLFLRLVYLAVAVFSATCLYRAVLPFRGRMASTLLAILALFFIPFSLPAPSYNTIGMYALVGAMSLFACGFERVSAGQESTNTGGFPSVLYLSCAWWAVGCVAYPPMLVPLTALGSLSLLFFRSRAERRLVVHYLIACVVGLAVAFVLLCAVLGLEHLVQMVRFTNAFNNVSGGARGKLHAVSAAFTAHPRFLLLCIGALVVAAARCMRSPAWQLLSDVATGLLVIGVATEPVPIFYSRTHDLVLVLAITGLLVASRALVFSESDRRARVLAAMFVASFVGGLTTATTAFNGLFNFPIGGFLAACLALVLPAPATGSTRTVQALVVGLACCAMAATTFTTYYGQIGAFSFRDSVRVSKGAFAGLRTDADQATFISRLSEAVDQQRGCGSRLAVFGTGPGFYLLTAMIPSTLSSWNYAGDGDNYATDAVRAFYETPDNWPDVVVVNTWQWATPLSKVDRALLEQYALVTRVTVGLRDASVYRRIACTDGARRDEATTLTPGR